MTNVSEMVALTLTPSSAAILRSCSQARCARPIAVFCTTYQKIASSTAVTATIRICLWETVTL